MKLQRFPVLRQMRARPRLFIAAAVGIAVGVLLPTSAVSHAVTHVAAVIGTSGQTADVSFTSKPMRRIGSLHCILAYLFNTTVLALLINIGASMF